MHRYTARLRFLLFLFEENVTLSAAVVTPFPNRLIRFQLNIDRWDVARRCTSPAVPRLFGGSRWVRVLIVALISARVNGAPGGGAVAKSVADS